MKQISPHAHPVPQTPSLRVAPDCPRGPLSAQAEHLEEVLPRLMRALFTLHPPDPSLDLPLAQLRVCTILQAGSHTMSALSREMRCTVSATTQLADRLEAAGLVERLADAEDRRAKCLQLTVQGEKMMRARREVRTERAREALRRLTPEMRAHVLRALDSLLEACQGQAPPSPANPEPDVFRRLQH